MAEIGDGGALDAGNGPVEIAAAVDAPLQPLQRIFDTVPLTSSQWGICLLAPLVFIALAEAGKLLDRRAAERSPAADGTTVSAI